MSNEWYMADEWYMRDKWYVRDAFKYMREPGIFLYNFCAIFVL